MTVTLAVFSNFGETHMFQLSSVVVYPDLVTSHPTSALFGLA